MKAAMFCRRALLAAAGLVILGSTGCDQSRSVLAPGTDIAANRAASRAPDIDYAAIDLGTLGGQTSIARDINERGQVIGNSITATGEDHPFLWTAKDGMIDLGTLAPGRPATASAINNAGIVVGVATNASGDERAVVWTEAGEIRDLGAPDGFTSRAEHINNAGIIVGSARPKGVPFVTHAIRWLPDGRMEDLGTFGGRNASIFAINNSGEMIVNVDLGPFVTRVLFIRRDKPPVDIGNLGGSNPQGGALALGLSNRGHVTGLTETRDGAFHAFLWSEEEGMRDIAADDDVADFSIGSSINSVGTIVGQRIPFLATPRGFVWTDGSGLHNLGVTGEAIAINESGDIVGVSEVGGTPAPSHATLWRRAHKP